MPDLALLITQVLLSSKTLIGPMPNQLLSKVPYSDFIEAMVHELPSLVASLDSDTRNVLLTIARMWCTLETDTIHTKPESASWAMSRLPKKYHPVLQRAKAIYLDEEIEHWDDINKLVKPCVKFMADKVKEKISKNELSEKMNKVIKLN